MREAGLAADDGSDDDEVPAPLPHAVHDASIGIPRPREFDSLTVVEAPGLEGEAVEFVALADGDLVVLEQEGDGDLSPLADAVESRLDPPYRARGVRHTDILWSLAAIPVAVVRMEAEGSIVDIAMHADERTATVDHEPTRERFQELERLGEAAGPNYVVHAERLDDDLWQARVTPL